MKLYKRDDKYIFQCNQKEESIPKDNGFYRHQTEKYWFTKKPEIAKTLIQYVSPVDINLIQELDKVEALTIQRMIDSAFIDYDFNRQLFYYDLDYKIKDYAKDFGFVFDWDIKKWISNDFAVLDKVLKDKHKFSQQALNQYTVLKKKHNEKVAESLRHHSDLVIPKKVGLNKDYFPYQKVAVEFAQDRNYKILESDLMGSGKSVIGMGIINYFPQNLYLIVCPVTAIDVWRNHIEDWAATDYEVHILRKNFPSQYNQKSIFIVNYEILYKFADHLKNIPFNFLIADEIHRVKNHKTRQGKAFYSLEHKFPYKVYMTGTPIDKNISEFYHVLNSLGFSEAQNWYKYHKKFCNDGYGNIGKQFISNIEEFNSKLRKELMIRREKSEIMPDLPPKIRSVYRPTFSKLDLEDIRLHQKYEFDSIKSMESDYSSDIGENSKLLKLIALKKIPYTINFAKGLLEDHDKIIIFAYHREAQEEIYKALSEYNPVQIKGGDSPTARGIAQNKFQTDPNCRLAVLSLIGASEAITMTAASAEIMHDTFWTPAKILQAEDRGHRIGQLKTLLIYFIVAEGTIDAHRAQMMVDRLDLIEKAVNTPEGFSKEELAEIEKLRYKPLSQKEILAKMLSV